MEERCFLRPVVVGAEDVEESYFLGSVVGLVGLIWLVDLSGLVDLVDLVAAIDSVVLQLE